MNDKPGFFDIFLAEEKYGLKVHMLYGSIGWACMQASGGRHGNT